MDNLQCSKAAGADGIVNEFMKFGEGGGSAYDTASQSGVENKDAPRR